MHIYSITCGESCTYHIAGVRPVTEASSKLLKSCYHVLLDGRVIGYVARREAAVVADNLRALKIRRDNTRVPRTTEIVLIRATSGGQYPGLFIFTGPARMMRPVVNLAMNDVELIGSFEQVYMEICVTRGESYKGVTTHQELRQTGFLSNLACTIPLPDFNQSPRNMYQCQMGKQTMATPTHTWHLNAETKMYRLQTPTSPFFRPAHYDHIGMDHYPMGTNAVVAVISYTGYDMEDAMIINKSSHERGFAAGSIYKTKFVDLLEVTTGKKQEKASGRFGDGGASGLIFARDPNKPNLAKHLDVDGLPYPGVPLNEGDPLYCFVNLGEEVFTVKQYDGKELCFVDSVKLLGRDRNS